MDALLRISILLPLSHFYTFFKTRISLIFITIFLFFVFIAFLYIYYISIFKSLILNIRTYAFTLYIPIYSVWNSPFHYPYSLFLFRPQFLFLVMATVSLVNWPFVFTASFFLTFDEAYWVLRCWNRYFIILLHWVSSINGTSLLLGEYACI